MQQIRQIQTLESLASQPFVAPAGLVEWAEEFEASGRPWTAMWAAPEGADPKTWMLIDSETLEGRLYLEDGDDVLEGRWWPEHQRFQSVDGSWVDLLGRFHPFGEDDPADLAEDEDSDEPQLADEDVEEPLF